MASYTIPEEVTGIPFFVPDGHDYFEIVSGGLPNGDPSLRVRGDISADYKAFCPLPVTSPNIGANNTSWAFSCWAKLPATGGTGSDFTHLILSAMRGDFASTGPGSTSFISLNAWTTPQIGFVRAIGSAGASQFAIRGGVRNNTWTLLTVNVPNTSQTGAFYQNESTVVGFDTQTAQANPSSPLYLAIGKYSSMSGPTSWPVDFQIAKIAFHDHHLNATERSLMWNAMMGFTSVGCTVNRAPSQEDPTTDTSIVFHVVFSESVTGFGTGEVTLSGTAGATTVGVSGTGTTYIVTVSGMTTPGTVIVSVDPGVVTGISGGTNLASVAIDNTVVWS